MTVLSAQPESRLSEPGANSDYTSLAGGNWAGDTYTGQGEAGGFSHVLVSLQTDEAGVLFFEFSVDAVNWGNFPINGVTVTPNRHVLQPAVLGEYRYFRVRFVGTGGRTYFRLQTTYTNTPLQLSAPLSQSLNPDQPAVTVRSVGEGQVAGAESGTFKQVQVTADGATLTSTVTSLINFRFDSYDLDDSGLDFDVWRYYLGGLGGTLVATVTVGYSGSDKAVQVSAARTTL